MIKTKDSLKLASIKIRTRKIRNLFSGCSIALGVVTILVFLLGANALGSLLQNAFKDSTEGKYFSNESIYSVSSDLNPDSKIENPKELSESEYKARQKDYKIKKVYKQYFSNADISIPELGIDKLESQYGPELSVIDNLFIQDFIDANKNISFEKEYVKNGEKLIPILLPKQYILDKKLGILDANLSSKEKYEKSQKVLNEYLGTKLTLEIRNNSIIKSKNQNPYSQKDSDIQINSEDIDSTKINAVVVGYHLGASAFDLSLQLGNKIYLPKWFYDSNEEIRTFFEGEQINYIPEFETKAERDRFIKDNTYNPFSGTSPKENLNPNEISNIQPVYSRFEAFQTIFDIVRNIIFGIGIFFLVIAGLFILTTVGKIIADSKKEIGVFRAIGAQRFDIMKIYFSYTFLLTSLGFLIGLGLALFINILASLFWGSDIYYQIATYATTSSLQKPLFIFIGFPILEVVGLYLFTLLAGFIAAFIPVFSASRIDPIKALREE